MTWPVFLIARTDRARESLRRYASPSTCAAGRLGIHDASVVLGEIDYPDDGYNGRGADDFPHDDPRWPVACACGYVFTESDTWQHNINRLYAGGDWRGILREAPVGAMWDVTWMDVWPVGPDGRALFLKLPDGMDWGIDGPATNSPTGWDRTGEPPLITARPSIDSGCYHGWLTDGELSDDLEGRTYG